MVAHSNNMMTVTNAGLVLLIPGQKKVLNTNKRVIKTLKEKPNDPAAPRNSYGIKVAAASICYAVRAISWPVPEEAHADSSLNEHLLQCACAQH